jgi:FkbM family methyltransferase
MPDSLRLCDRVLKLAVPAEVRAGLVFINLALDDEYGLRELPYQPRTILDIGANFGLFSLLAAHNFRNAKIHAYEPNPRIFPYASKNLRLIDATVFQAGVGSRSGFAEIIERKDSLSARTIFSNQGSIQIVAFRRAIERMGSTVDLLKLDCEGAEWDIFQDTDAFQKVRLVRMEYHLTDGHRLEDLKACAKKLCFQIDRLSSNQRFGIAWLSRRASWI